jgi:hypothetical protein
MATATLLSHIRHGWNENINAATYTITSASINIAAGDYVVCLASVIGASTSTFPNVPVSSGAGPSWTGSLITSVNASAVYNPVSGIWGVQASGAATGITVSLTYNSVAGSGDQALDVMSIWKVTSYDTGTPVRGKAVTQAQAGNGAVTVTCDGTAIAGDAWVAQCAVDENTTNKTSTFGTTGGTWTTDADGTASGKLLAYNVGHRTGATGTQADWSDVNTGTDNFGSTQAVLIVRDASGGGGGSAAFTSDIIPPYQAVIRASSW